MPRYEIVDSNPVVNDAFNTVLKAGRVLDVIGADVQWAPGVIRRASKIETEFGKLDIQLDRPWFSKIAREGGISIFGEEPTTLAWKRHFVLGSPETEGYVDIVRLDPEIVQISLGRLIIAMDSAVMGLDVGTREA